MELDCNIPPEQADAVIDGLAQDAAAPQETATADAAALQALVERLERLEQGVAGLSLEIARLGERTGMIPPQVRQLRERVDNITESISQPRIRDLLHGLLLLYDLAESLAAGSAAEPAHARNYQVFCDQIMQILRVNGISPIAEAERFDPYQHKAIETIPCLVPEEDDLIARRYRKGFRTEQSVLRYADVAVKRYQAPVAEEEQP